MKALKEELNQKEKVAQVGWLMFLNEGYLLLRICEAICYKKNGNCGIH